MKKIPWLALALAVVGCGGGGTGTNDLAMSGGGDMAMAGGGDMAMGSGGDMAGGGGDMAGGGMVTLTMSNYLSWCSVAINGGAATTTDQTLMVAPGTKVTLTGDKANASFVWGYWQEKGGAKTTGMTLMVTMDADKTIQACCPFANMPDQPCPAP